MDGTPSPLPPDARVAPLGPDELGEAVAELPPEMVRGLLARDPPLNVFATLARHRTLFQAWIRFGAVLLGGGELPARDRELMILRTAWHCRSPYEWGQHVLIGLAVEVTQDEIERVPDGPGAPGWADFDSILLRAVDELHAQAVIGDATWSALAERYSEQQLIELPMLVGQYHMVAFALNSLGVQPESELPAFPT